MAFPDDSLDLTVEAAFGADLTAPTSEWDWTDLSDRLNNTPCTITRGGRDGTGVSAASSAVVSLDDNDKALTPLHPMSANYPHVVQGLPLRAYRGLPHQGAGSGNAASSTSHIAPSVDAAADNSLLICGWLGNAGPGNYTLPPGMTAGPAETDGSQSTMRTATQVLAASGPTGTRTATFTVNHQHAAVSVAINGSVTIQESLSGRTPTRGDLTLTTAASTQAGWWIVAIHGWRFDRYNMMTLAPADNTGGWYPLADSRRIGVGPHVRAWARQVVTAGAQKITFYDRTDKDGTVNDNHAAVYVLSGVDNFSVRFAQFAASYRPSYTPTTNGMRAVQSIGCGGTLRRLEKGTTPARSAIKRQALSPLNSPYRVAYWPCEDGSDATQIAEGSGGAPATISGPVSLASYSGFPGSLPIALLKPGGFISGDIPAYPDGQFAFRGIYSATTAGLLAGQSIIDVECTGTGHRWQVIGGGASPGSVNFRVLDLAGNLIDETGFFNLSNFFLGLRFLISVEAVQNGPNVNALLFVRRINADNTSVDADTAVIADTFAGVTVGHATRITAGAATSTTDLAVGHLMMGSSTEFVFGINEAIVGHIGERAGRRLARIWAEEGIVFHPIGDLDDTQEMDVQPTGTPVDISRDCEATDLGIFGETRQDFGLQYVTTGALYNRSPALTIDLSTYRTGEGESRGVLAPIYDDQVLRNDVTVSRIGGSSLRMVDDASQVRGVYDHDVEVNLAADDQLIDITGWLLRQGTVDGYRHPTLSIDLSSNPELISAWEVSDVGARIRRTNPPDPYPPGAIDQIMLGYTETIGPKRWRVAAVGAPWTYDVGVYGTAPVVSRYDSAHSTLAAGVDADDTALSVATEAGHALWVTGSTAPTFPFDVVISGIRLTVTAISGASSPQTFTVTRNVDGIDKPLAAGEQVRLYHPDRYAL